MTEGVDTFFMLRCCQTNRESEIATQHDFLSNQSDRKVQIDLSSCKDLT